MQLKKKNSPRWGEIEDWKIEDWKIEDWKIEDWRLKIGRLLDGGEDDFECSAFSGGGDGVNISTVVFGYFFAHRQTNTGTLIFCTRMQPLENIKDLVSIFLAKADAIVFERNSIMRYAPH